MQRTDLGSNTFRWCKVACSLELRVSIKVLLYMCVEVVSAEVTESKCVHTFNMHSRLKICSHDAFRLLQCPAAACICAGQYKLSHSKNVKTPRDKTISPQIAKGHHCPPTLHTA